MKILNRIYYALKLKINKIKDKKERKIAHLLNKQSNYICVTSTAINELNSIEKLNTLINKLEIAEELANNRLSELLSKN
tara:strand:- start:134 stop:370 length:237 start_codon:yes stop_codon:yes gene_type:complete